MDGFTFYGAYYETLSKIKKVSDRQAVLSAMLEFVFEDKEPQGLSEVAEIVFETFRKSLTKSKNNAGRGGRKSRNRIETDCKPISNRIETDCEPISNDGEKRFQNGFKEREVPLKEHPEKDKERSKEKEKYIPQENIPQENHSLTAGACLRVEGTACMTCAEFLRKYPNVTPDVNIAAYGLDWDLLDEKFQNSTKYLQGEPHDLSWVKNNYRRIIGDVYRDKQENANGMGYNGMAFFDEITANLKAREAKANDG